VPISSLIVENWFNGLYTAAMLVTLWVIITGTRYTGSRMRWQIALVLASYICSTMHSSLNWLYYSQAVDDNELPTGPGLLYSLTHLKGWIEATGVPFFCLSIFIADCLFIWRCWVVWNRRWYIVVLPILATISGVILAGFMISDQVVAVQSSEAFTIAKKSADFVRHSTIYFSLSVATSLTTTFLITLRILLVQRMGKDAGTGSHRTFNPITEILIESAPLYSATLLTFVVLDVKKDTNLYYAQNIYAQMAGLAPLLIILRVAARLSRPQEDWSGNLSGSLKFAPSHSTLSASKQGVEA